MEAVPRDLMKEISERRELELQQARELELQQARDAEMQVEGERPMPKKRHRSEKRDQSLDLNLAKLQCEFAIAGPHDDLCQALIITVDDSLCDDALECKHEQRARAFTVIPGTYWAMYPNLNCGLVFKQEPKGDNSMELYLFMPTSDKWVIASDLYIGDQPENVEVFCELNNSSSSLPETCISICGELEKVEGICAIPWAQEARRHLKEKDGKIASLQAEIERLEADGEEKNQLISSLEEDLEALNEALSKKERNTERSNLGQVGQHGGWMPRFCSLAQQYDARHWSACRTIIDQALEKSHDLRRMYYSKKRGGGY